AFAPLFFIGLRPELPLPHPLACIAEHAHPRCLLAPLFRVPGMQHATEYAFGMRHQYGEAAIRRGDRGNTLRRTIRIQRVTLGSLAVMVDVTHGHDGLADITGLREVS